MAKLNTGHEPLPGFVKVSKDKRPTLTGEQRSALIRKGNELFNADRIDEARRIFLTAGYSDGLIRLGDHYYRRKQPLEAFKMYRQASATDRSSKMIEQMAGVVRHWLQEDDGELSESDS
ncbi:MAG: tetratricopeptide repeat protein [Spirochaetaceae bacterium]